MLTNLILLYWLFLTALVVVGGMIGAWQLRSRNQRVSLYLSRILIAIALRSLLTFIGLCYWRDTIQRAPIYIALSAFAATLLCGAIWGWLFYVAGLWNGGGWRGFYLKLRGTSMSDKERVEDEDAAKPASPTTPPSGDGANADNGADRDGVVDGPGK